jgi:transposase
LYPRANIACGLDVHKSSISAAVYRSDGSFTTHHFSTMLDGLTALREWVVENRCERVLMEATGIYWIPPYTAIESLVEVYVVNPLSIKYLPGRKTDTLDAVWLAEIALNGMFKASYIPPRAVREFRELTRTHRKLVEERTAHKNRIHKILERSGIRLSGVLSDIFGKSGLLVITGLIAGKPIEQILATLHDSRILKKRDAIERAICGDLGENEVFIIRQSLESIKHVNAQIAQYEERILRTLARDEESLQIVTSVPGIGFKVGAVILAEIGDISQFAGPKNLVSWAGLAPAVYESAGKTAHGHITKRGSKYLRTVLIETAQVIANGKPNRLKQFFLRIRTRKGYKMAIVALARKVLALIHHLLTNHERYDEPSGTTKTANPPKVRPDPGMDHAEMIQLLTQAGYVVRKLNAA